MLAVAQVVRASRCEREGRGCKSPQPPKMKGGDDMKNYAERERVRMALPGGEMENDTLQFMRNIGLEFNAVDRRYLH